MTPGIAHLSWDKNNNQWGITAYDNGNNPQFVFTFSKDGDKGTLPVSMTLSDNTDDICAFADINDGSFGGTIKDAAITITYDGNGYQYDNVGKRHYVMAKISGEVSNAYHKLIVNEPADYIKVFVPSPEEIYAVWDAPNTTLTLYYNDQRIAQNGETDWSSYASTATTVVLDASMQDARPTSTAKWFFTFSKMTAIQNLEYLNTSEVECDEHGKYVFWLFFADFAGSQQFQYRQGGGYELYVQILPFADLVGRKQFQYCQCDEYELYVLLL